jgi:hypothetical protein
MADTRKKWPLEYIGEMMIIHKFGAPNFLRIPYVLFSIHTSGMIVPN